MPALTVLDFHEETFELIVKNFNYVLDKVPDLPIVTLSICGCMREGKSFVMSYFIRYLKNRGKGDWLNAVLRDDEMFSWRSGGDRETVGINIWSEPFVIEQNGRKVAVILLDTQGLFDNETTEAQNTWIFSLCCLLSSFMIYNRKEKIDESVLEIIQRYSRYGNAIASKLPEHQNTRPYLLFLFRDFAFVEEYEFGFHNKVKYPKRELEDPKNYFDLVFTQTPEMQEENRKVRADIMENYSEIGMFLMPNPGKKFIRSPKKNAPDKEFSELLKELVEHIMSHLVTKRVGAEEVTGRSLKRYIQKWAELCRSAEFPQPEVIGDLEMRRENDEAFRKALDKFQKNCDKKIKSKSPETGEEKFREELRPLIYETVKSFKESRTLGSGRDVRKYVLDLSTDCVIYFNASFKTGQQKYT